MSEELDNIFDPENLKPKQKKDDKEMTEKRLNSLRELLKSDNTDFNADNHMIKNSDLPASENIAYIDYAQKEIEYNIAASEIINGFITNYVKSDELLNSVKLKSIRNQHIEKLANLQLLVGNIKRNLIMIQEAIDGGDMSIEMFKLSIDQTRELGSRIEAISKHIESCDTYWEKYASTFGLENKEEKIIREKEISSDDSSKTIVIDTTALNTLIDQKIKESDDKKREAEEKKNAKKS
jgi:hypothetical protein